MAHLTRPARMGTGGRRWPGLKQNLPDPFVGVKWGAVSSSLSTERAIWTLTLGLYGPDSDALVWAESYSDMARRFMALIPCLAGFNLRHVVSLIFLLDSIPRALERVIESLGRSIRFSD